MSEKSIRQEFGLKNIDETRNYLIEEINQKQLMSQKHKKIHRALNYIDDLFFLTPTVTGCVHISAFASLVAFPKGITSSAIGLKICVTNEGIKKYKSIIKTKKKKKHDKILGLVKFKLNSVGVLISKTLIDSDITHDEFVLINNVSKEFNDIKEKIKNCNNK